MKHKLILVFLGIYVAIFFLACSTQDKVPIQKGPYSGQADPGESPRIFAPGFISTGLYERDISMDQNGTEIYYGIGFGKYVTIMVTRSVDGRWIEPEVASFASDLNYFYFEPCLSHDGKKILFLCTRPPEGEEPKAGWGHQNIWASDRKENGEWSEPYDLGPPINSDQAEYFPSLTKDGTLYFTRQTSDSGSFIYRSRWVDGQYKEPERLPDTVNKKGNLYNACIAGDESFLVSCMAESEDGSPPGTAVYCVFFHRSDDSWSEGIKLGESINTPGVNASSPSLSPDGKYFFFSSARTGIDDLTVLKPLKQSRILEYHNNPQNGHSDIYWVNAEVIYRLKPPGLN